MTYYIVLTILMLCVIVFTVTYRLDNYEQRQKDAERHALRQQAHEDLEKVNFLYPE